MTTSEMIYEFRVGFDAMVSNSSPGFTDTEIISLFNKAQDSIIYFAHVNKKYELVRTLVKDSSSDRTPGSNGLLPSDFRFPVSLKVQVDRNDSSIRTSFTDYGNLSNKEVLGEYVEPDIFDKSVVNAYNRFKNYRKIPWTIKGGYFYYSVGDVIATPSGPPPYPHDVYLTYIKMPATISDLVTSELPEFAHKQLVEETVQLAKKSVLSQNTPAN